MNNLNAKTEDLQIHFSYLMENSEEIYRLEQKTDSNSLQKQAIWAGLKPGMRVLDVGCGSGITTKMLKALVGSKGDVVGIDASAQRIAYATKNYSDNGVTFIQKDIYSDMNCLGKFDFIWVRFFLEYHANSAQNIIKFLVNLLSPNGILCLLDLDNNSNGHFGLSERLQKAINNLLTLLASKHDFDPYMGRKLYTYMYEAGLKDIDVQITAHHLIFGPLQKKDLYNWKRKLEVAVSRCGYNFPDYENGFEEFKEEFLTYLSYPYRFTYTPLISCCGKK